MKKVFNTENLVLADLRVYEKGKGAIFDENMPKVFLIKRGDKYCNVFNEKEKYPLFKRVPYSNVSIDGESYGSKLIPASNVELEEVGVCAIECDDDLINKIREETEIEIKELERIIIEQDKMYFKDRRKIVQDNYEKELEEIRYKYPLKEEKGFYDMYRFSTRLKMNLGLNRILREQKTIRAEDKYFDILDRINSDVSKNIHYNDEVTKIKIKDR